MVSQNVVPHAELSVSCELHVGLLLYLSLVQTKSAPEDEVNLQEKGLPRMVLSGTGSPGPLGQLCSH